MKKWAKNAAPAAPTAIYIYRQAGQGLVGHLPFSHFLTPNPGEYSSFGGPKFLGKILPKN